MVHLFSRWLLPIALPIALPAALLIATLTAQAQSTARAAKPDPLDSNASVPALAYESSLSRFRRPGDEKPVSWREANDSVARIGGWRVYAREAQQPDPAPAEKPPGAATPAETTKPMPMLMPPGHGGHKTP